MVKPGQVDAGTGTTPTLMGRKYVAITDNADPMNVVVYKRARSVRGQAAGVRAARVPQGQRGHGELADRHRPLPDRGEQLRLHRTARHHRRATTTPGIQRVDVQRNGRGCRTVWKSNEIAPSVVPKLSLRNGLAYFYTKPAGLPERWYLTAVSFRTGKTVWRKLVGTGFDFNNNYAGLAISPRRVLYLGVLGGTVRVADRCSARMTPPRSTRRRMRPGGAALGGCRGPGAGTDGEHGVTREQAEALGREAYRYGLPLLEFLRVRTGEHEREGSGQGGQRTAEPLQPRAAFAGPENRTVVAPNVDTLYSIAQLDLGKGPIVLRHPNCASATSCSSSSTRTRTRSGTWGPASTGSKAGRFAISWTKRPGKRVRGVSVIRSQLPAPVGDRAHPGQRRGRPAARVQA